MIDFSQNEEGDYLVDQVLDLWGSNEDSEDKITINNMSDYYGKEDLWIRSNFYFSEKYSSRKWTTECNSDSDGSKFKLTSDF